MPTFAPKSLKQRIFRAGAWTVGGHALAQAIRFGSNLLMTRLLVPEMFGVMAVAMMLTTIIYMFSDLGIRQSVIRSKQGNTPEFLNTAWVTQILRGFLIFLITLIVSFGIYIAGQHKMLPIGSTFAEPILPSVLAVISISALIAGFESTKVVTIVRNLSFGRLVLIELLSQVTALISMIFYALLISRSIWALVVAALVAALTKTILSHTALPGLANRFQWHDTSFREIFGFGKWIFVSSILGVVLASGDRLILGTLESAEILGFYSIAFLIMGAFKDLIYKIMSGVAYSALSEIARERPSDLNASYYKFRTPIDLLTLFLLGFLIMSGAKLINILYDPRYHAAGQQLEILAWSLFAFRFGLAQQCYLTLGKPILQSVLNIISVIGLYISTPIAHYYFGLNAALWAIVFSSLLPLPLMFVFNYKNGLLNIRKEFQLLSGLPIGIAAGLGFNALYLAVKPI